MGARASGTSTNSGDAPKGPRLRGGDRRAALLDAAAALLATHGVDAVGMDSVAARAGVSRALVYKHFTNRDELLAEVLRHEAAEVDAAIVAAVRQASGFEDKIRALIRSVLDAVGSHGAVFGPLLRAGLRDPGFGQEQRARDRRTVQFFARLATSELGLAKPDATAAIAVLLTGIESIRAQMRAHPTPEHRRYLEDIYVDLVVGGLTHIRDNRK
jgi:AcrR family transcriptional regulator